VAAFGGPYERVLRIAGAQLGAAPAAHYLPLVADGRIDVRPGIAAIEDDTVRFADGGERRVDAVVLATGYELSLPYLGARVEDLVLETFARELPGLALMRQYVLHGP
jgi:cation diffusion facilitator CzcD-associated flavoprotein CzcO